MHNVFCFTYFYEKVVCSCKAFRILLVYFPVHVFFFTVKVLSSLAAYVTDSCRINVIKAVFSYNLGYRCSLLCAAFPGCRGSVDTDASWGLKSEGCFHSPLTVQTLVNMSLIWGQSKKSNTHPVPLVLNGWYFSHRAEPDVQTLLKSPWNQKWLTILIYYGWIPRDLELK